MTKKLKEMMSTKPSKKKKRKKKVPRKDRSKHRGITFAPNIGDKRAMEILYDVIKFQGHVVPEVDLTVSDPASTFAINMYAEIGSWDYKHLKLFIQEITGKPPQHKEIASLLGTAKSIFHTLFMDEDDSKAKVLRYDSKWKMWPKVRTKPRRKKMADSKLATKKKASRKKASKKKVTKKTQRKKAPAKKKVAKKKVAKKKTAKKKAPSVKGLSESSKIKKVKDAGTPKMANRKTVMSKVPPAGIKASTLMERTGCTLRTIEAMIKKGFLTVA